MARLLPGRYPRHKKMVRVEWTELDRFGKRHSRSRQLDKQKQALTFKRLVEENNERFPSYVTLREHGLLKFGYDIEPEYVLDLRDWVFSDEADDDEKIEVLKSLMKDF